ERGAERGSPTGGRRALHPGRHRQPDERPVLLGSPARSLDDERGFSLLVAWLPTRIPGRPGSGASVGLPRGRIVRLAGGAIVGPVVGPPGTLVGRLLVCRLTLVGRSVLSSVAVLLPALLLPTFLGRGVLQFAGDGARSEVDAYAVR